MSNWSFWERDTLLGHPDLLVVGSGIVGLSAALHFQEKYPSARVTVLEAGHLPSGASTKNAGFACFGSPSELLMDLETSTEAEVWALLRRRWDGLQNLRQLLGDEAIGYEAPGSHELFLEGESAIYQRCLDHLPDLNARASQVLGFAPYEVDEDLPQRLGLTGMRSAIRIAGEGQIHTGRMMDALLRKARLAGVRLINGLPVESVQPHASGVRVATARGDLDCRACLVATNGFASSLLPALQVQPARAQVLITEPVKDLQVRGTFHFDRGYYYFRNVGDRILFGGGRNLDVAGETTTEQALHPRIQEELDHLLHRVILPGKNAKVAQRWTGIMGVGSDKVPVLRQLEDSLFVAVRLGGMGIAIGSLLGREAAELVSDSSFS